MLKFVTILTVLFQTSLCHIHTLPLNTNKMGNRAHILSYNQDNRPEQVRQFHFL